MKIKGLQKVTLIDYPDKIACTIFLFGCNFKCGFCHNPELVLQEQEALKDISKEEVLNFLEKRKDKLEGVCFTGGEPLLSLDEDFLKEIKNLGYSIKIDTNGSFPEKLKKLIDEDLVDFVSMDIKSSRERYNEIVNANADINKIEESIRLVSSLKDYEFRTTVLEDFHNIDEMKKISEWLNGLIGKPKKFSLQAFRNNGKFVDEKFMSHKSTDEKLIMEIKDAIKDFFDRVEIRV
jgi:pyruvate formate lyase activating enzyme